MSSHLVLIRQDAADDSTYPPPAAPGSLRSSEGLADVERLMGRLAGGDRLDRTGVMVQEHLATGGKRMRTRLTLAAAEALGVDRETAVPWGAAVELLHNATLVHDDIQDGDLIRRGQPTVWVRHGVPQAINAGDLMLMLPTLAVEQARVDDGIKWRLSRCLASHACRTVRGQSEELDLLSSGHLDGPSYHRAVRGKTGSLFALPIEGAALLAGRSADLSRQLGDLFVELGVLFQLQDDVLDLYGDKGRGLAGSDLEEGKVSALVVAHLERCPEDHDWLLALLRAPRDKTPRASVDRAIRRFRDCGALDDVLERIQAIAAALSASSLLREEPALRTVALDVCALAVAPIGHLLPADGGGWPLA